jgi:hypothetical protein
VDLLPRLAAYLLNVLYVTFHSNGTSLRFGEYDTLRQYLATLFLKLDEFTVLRTGQWNRVRGNKVAAWARSVDL